MAPELVRPGRVIIARGAGVAHALVHGAHVLFQLVLAPRLVRAQVAGEFDAAVDGVLVELELVGPRGREVARVAVEPQALVCHLPTINIGE